MKTIVFSLKEGFENKTNLGYKRIELIPGHCTPFVYGVNSDNPTLGCLSYCFEDGKLGIFTGDVNEETSDSVSDSEAAYIMTYEESIWL